MPWKDHLNKLKNEFNTLSKEVESGVSKFTGSGQAPQQQQQQQPYYPQQRPGPPPPAGASAYWRPRFDQNVAVTEEWDAKMGNGPDGWGNQELQHYTALPQNTFQ